MMLSPVDQRLASLMHLAQIERVLRVESIGADAEQLIRRTFRQIITASRDPRFRLRPVLDGLLQQINHLLADRFVRFAAWSHSSTVEVYAKGIPRRWMRALSPVGVLAGEDVQIDLGPGFAEIPDLLNNPPEPTIDNRLSDDEWAAFLEQHLFKPPPPAKVEQIILKPVAGFTWPQRVESLSRLVQQPEQLASQLRDGYAAGETLDQLTRRVMPLADNWASSARRIARTEGMRIAEDIQRETYQQLGPLLSGMQIVATLDEHTRAAHRLWNGRVYWNDLRRKPNINEFPSLPAGPNCRCISVPVLKPPKEFEADPAIRAQFQNATQDTIPDPSAYSDWFRQADVGRRKMAVGVRRYQTVQRLLGGREPQWQDFIDGDGNLLSVNAIRGETQRQRDARVAKVSTAIAQRMQLLGDVTRYGFVPKLKPNTPPPRLLPRPSPPPPPPAPTFTVPKHLSRSSKSEPTELTKAVWREMRDGPESESHARSVGALIRNHVVSQVAADEAELVRLKAMERSAVQAGDENRLDISRQVIAQQRKIRTARKDAMLASLKDIRDFGGVSHQTTGRKAMAQAIHDAEQFFPADWLKVSAAAGPIKLLKRQRGFYKSRPRSIALSYDGDVEVATHELIHAMEHTVRPAGRKKLVELESEFLARRAAGESQSMIYPPKRSEMGYKDQFLDHYMGKVYPWDYREILTMGWQWLTHPAAGQSLWDDPDMTDFVLGCLAGA